MYFYISKAIAGASEAPESPSLPESEEATFVLLRLCAVCAMELHVGWVGSKNHHYFHYFISKPDEVPQEIAACLWQRNHSRFHPSMATSFVHFTLLQ
jgi:hypothetical protein